ncbi:MAG: hypothetical protein NXI24_12925 [bacterium]|nr:hypothetical protein [bacterium]
MNASACQREAGVSCGACCGIFNLDLRNAGPDPVRARSDLLIERTRAFATVRFDQAADFVAYRQAREAAEESIPRFNSEIYACPFFGLIDWDLSTDSDLDVSGDINANGDRDGEGEGESGASGRTGCLAHPARTGLDHTQNFSFYGASICQAYDCRNKDQDADQEQRYSRLLARWFGQERAPGSGASESYARLMADVPLYAFLERFDGLIDRLARSDDPQSTPLCDFLRLARLRMATLASAGITSFEVEMQRHPDLEAELRSLLARGPLQADQPAMRDEANPISAQTIATIVANFKAMGAGTK